MSNSSLIKPPSKAFKDFLVDIVSGNLGNFIEKKSYINLGSPYTKIITNDILLRNLRLKLGNRYFSNCSLNYYGTLNCQISILEYAQELLVQIYNNDGYILSDLVWYFLFMDEIVSSCLVDFRDINHNVTLGHVSMIQKPMLFMDIHTDKFNTYLLPIISKEYFKFVTNYDSTNGSRMTSLLLNVNKMKVDFNSDKVKLLKELETIKLVRYAEYLSSITNVKKPTPEELVKLKGKLSKAIS